MLKEQNQSRLSWTVIDSVDGLNAIWEEWDVLVRKTCQDAVFNSSAWLKTWFLTFWRQEWELFVYLGKDAGGRILAIIPLYKQKVVSMPRRYSIHPLGQGEPEIAEVASEYQDIIVAEENRGEVLDYMDLCVLPKIHELRWNAVLDGSAALAFCEKNCQIKKSKRYWIDRKDWDIQSLSKNDRKKISRLENGLRRVGASCEWLDHSHFGELWLKMKGFHQTRWAGRGRFGAMADEGFSSFHRDICCTHELGVFSVLKIEQKIVAVNYYIKGDDCLYFYQCGWDSVNYKALSPGFMLHLWSIKHMSARFYDFMMGGYANSYKASFGCDVTMMYSLELCRSKLVWLGRLSARLISKIANR